MILLVFSIFQGTISSFYDHVIWTKITIKQKKMDVMNLTTPALQIQSHADFCSSVMII